MIPNEQISGDRVGSYYRQPQATQYRLQGTVESGLPVHWSLLGQPYAHR